MIKKLQQLKAKKGFTLVELIVVIAIIGVLAAILVPTMMGFVTSSRVTSANSTAASFEDQIEQFLTDCDTKGYGMKSGTASVATIWIDIQPDSWTTTIDAAALNATTGSFKKNSTTSWGTGTAMSSADTAIAESDNATNLMSIKLMSLFPDLQQGTVIAWVRAGNVEALVYTADGNAYDDLAAAKAALGDVASATYTTANNVTTLGGSNVNWANKVANWDTKTAGISNTGLTVGTSPALALGDAAAPQAPASTN
ncbi:MAG: DUF5021 domain-containing protein [Ruminiclostridium sp.]|nr:DUF5021 domain-containing protein [Ruminiclostridium sp.]